MRTVLTTLALLTLVPAAALADDSKTDKKPRYVLTINGSDQPAAANGASQQPMAVEHRTPVEPPKPVEPPRPAEPPSPAAQPKPPEHPKPAEPPKVKNGGYVAPESAPYEGGAIPKDAFIEKRPNFALVGAGASIAGTAYVASVIAAVAACPPQSTCSASPGAGWLYLPLIGPFVTATMATSPGGAALAAFDGGLQVVGGALAIAGVLAPKKFVVWQDQSTSLKITPSVGAPPMPGETRPAMSAGISLTLTHM